MNTTNGKMQWELIPQEVKKILHHKKVKNIPKNFMLKDDPFLYGLVDGEGDHVLSWNVFHNNPHGALTAVHETGHLLDILFLTSKQRKKILDIVKSSDEYQAMLAEHKSLNTNKISNKKKKYRKTLADLLKPEELIARSFAEFESNINKGELLEQLQNDAKLSSGTLKYFPSVASELKKVYTEILSEVGL